MIMAKTCQQLQGYSSPSKTKSASWKGFRHFSLKHHKLVAAKFPFLSESQIRSRVKVLWNKLSTEKKEEYTYSPEKVRSPSPKKFLKLSPDMFSWSPSKPYTRPLSPANSQHVDSRPLKSSWRAYLDTSSHSRDGQHKSNDVQQQVMQHKTGILVRHSENKDPKASSKSKTKKGQVTFKLFPRRALFATDDAPADISQESKYKDTSIDEHEAGSPIPRKDLFSSYRTATETSNKNAQEIRLNDTTSDEDKTTNTSVTNVAPIESIAARISSESLDEPVEATQICKETGEVETVGDDNKMKTGGNDSGMDCNKPEEIVGKHDGDDSMNLEECKSVETTEESTQIDPSSGGQRNTQLTNNSCMAESLVAEVKNNKQVPPEVVFHGDNTINEQKELPVCPPGSASESIGDGSQHSMEDEERIVAEILTELGIIIAQEVSPERRMKAMSKKDDQNSKSSSDSLEGKSNMVENNETSGNLDEVNNEDRCGSSVSPEAEDSVDKSSSKDLVEQPSTYVTVTTESKTTPECTSQSDGKQETKRRGRPRKRKSTKSKVSNNNNTPSQNSHTRVADVLETSSAKDEDSPLKQVASPLKQLVSPEKQSKHFHLRRSQKNLRRSPRLADLELQKMHTIFDIRKQLKSPSKQLKSPSEQSPRKRTNNVTAEPPSTPPRTPSPERPKFSSPEFRVYDFTDEPLGKPKFSPAVSPIKRLTPPGTQSCIVPRCANSDDDDNDDITFPSTQSPTICVSPVWVDSTAKRLINKGLLKNKVNKKKAVEEYNLDSISNAPEFADKTGSHRTPLKRKRKSQLPVSIKFAKKKRQAKKTATDLPKRKRRLKSKKQLIPPAPANDASNNVSKPQDEEDELIRAISSLESESDPVASLLSMSPEHLFEEQHDLFGEDVSSPVSLIKDNWMYRYNEHSNVECSSDSEDNFISFRKDPTGGAIDEPLLASQKLCKKFAEFCNNLSQTSSGSSSPQSNDEKEEETVMELTLNAVALSPLYGMEDSEAYESELPDVDSVTKLLSDVDYNDEPQVESAALSAITSVLSSALDCLQESNSLGPLEDTSQIVEHGDAQSQIPNREKPVEEDNQTGQNEREEEVVKSAQQGQMESPEGVVPDHETPNNEDAIQEEDKIQEQVPEGKNDETKEQKEDKELEDIIDQTLKLSGISEESTSIDNNNNSNGPDHAGATTNGSDIFLQNAASDNLPRSKGPTDESPRKSADDSGDDDLLCNLFHQISPSPPRANHIPTPRASGRRLIASNRVETFNNFGGLFEDEDIFL